MTLSSRLLSLAILLCLAIASGHSHPYQVLEFKSPFEEAGGNFARDVEGNFDIDGDGYQDLLVGADLEDADSLSASGRAYVFSGATGAMVASLQSPYPQFNGRFGGSSTGLPDLNNDGFDEFAVAAWNEEVMGLEGAGRVYLFDGASRDTLFSLIAPDPEAGASFGVVIAQAGDVDNDGMMDIVIGALASTSMGVDNAGRAYVFHAADGSIVHEFDSPNPETNGGFGNWVASAGDLNSDGHAEVVVGAFLEEADQSPFAAGAAYVFDGQSGSVLYDLRSANEFSDGNFGGYVASASDVNNDAVPDIIVGARGEQVFFPGAGRVYVFSGLSGDTLFTLVSPFPETDGLFGSVAGIGDYDGDGFGDIAVGAAGEADGAGRLYLFSGQTQDTVHTFMSPNSSPNGFMGARIALAGDVNDDNEPDLIVSATREEPDGSPVDAGRAYVILLGTETNVALHDGPFEGSLHVAKNFPNPFRNETTIEYRVEKPSSVAIQVYDVSGRLVRNLRSQVQPAGDYEIQWDGRDDSGNDVGAGTYLIRFSVDNRTVTEKAIKFN